jgi:VanZ family protein
VKRAAWAFVPALAYAAIIFALSAQSDPLPFLPREIFLQDKLLHAAEYAVLGGLLVPALRVAGLRPRVALLAAVVVASAFGATDEFHQSFVPGRNADVADWLADTLGAAVGATLGALVATAALRPPGRAG